MPPCNDPALVADYGSDGNFVFLRRCTSLLSLSAVYCDLEDALHKNIDLITVSSLEQRPQMENDVRFRDTVLKERVNIYAAA